MAKILTSFEFKTGGSRGGRYPWGEWLDGQIRQLTAEDWGATKPNNLIWNLKKHAKLAGKALRLAFDKEGGTITFQAYPVEANAETSPDAQESVAPTAEPKKTRNKKA